MSAKDAYAQAGITSPRDQLAMAEVHDCFTPTELVLMEDLGFAERGTAYKEVLAGTYDLDGDLPVNPDGGLKSFGHPVGASGLRMMFEAWLQLRGEAPPERTHRHRRPRPGAHPQPRWLPGRDGLVRLDPGQRARLSLGLWISRSAPDRPAESGMERWGAALPRGAYFFTAGTLLATLHAGWLAYAGRGRSTRGHRATTVALAAARCPRAECARKADKHITGCGLRL